MRPRVRRLLLWLGIDVDPQLNESALLAWLEEVS